MVVNCGGSVCGSETVAVVFVVVNCGGSVCGSELWW